MSNKITDSLAEENRCGMLHKGKTIPIGYIMKMSIEETIDYDVFQRHECNRPVDETLVKRLMESIKKRNRLASKPICIDEDYKVIDGQHRLEAARRLGIPVFYCQDRYKTEDMLDMNVNQKQWNINDYLNFYSNVEGHPEYVKLKQFIEEEGLQVSMALQILNGERGTDFFRKFKDGLYKFPNAEEMTEALEKKRMIHETIDYIKKKTTGPKGYLDRVTFYTALVSFFNIKSFVYEVFMKKLQLKLDLMRQCTRTCDYVNIFKQIYNFKNTTPIDIE